MFQSEIREGKERNAAISILDFILAIQVFPKHTVTFLRHWCQYYWGTVALMQDVCQVRKRHG